MTPRHINWVCSRSKQTICFLNRHLRLADSRCLSRVYQASYCVANPELRLSCLEHLPPALYQHFAARVVTRRWRQPGPALAAQLNWPALKLRRSLAKVCLCRQILQNRSLIPSSAFSPQSNSAVRHTNSLPLFLPTCKD